MYENLLHSVSNDFCESHPTSIIYRYIYIHGVDTVVCTDSFDGEEKGSGKVKPEGRAEKTMLLYCPFIAERYSGEKNHKLN